MPSKLLSRWTFLCVVALLTTAVVAPVRSQGGGWFQGLGDLPGGNFFSHAWEVSADGTTVTGHSVGAFTTDQAFYWTQATGMVGLPDLPGGYDGSAGDGGCIT